MMKTILRPLPVLLLITINTFAQENPGLQIETNTHLEKIRKIASDAAGKYVLSCSDDKTARLWDATNGKLLKIYRVPFDSKTGKLLACSISPDAAIIAVGGETDFGEKGAYRVYIFDAQTESIIQNIKDLPETINDLAFSPNGKWLAISLWGNKGVEIYNAQTWELSKKLEGYEAPVYSMCFNATRNEFLTVSFDGMLRLYNNDFNLITQADCDVDKQPVSVACNNTGNLLAIGYNRPTYPEIRDAKTLALLYQLPVPDSEGLAGKLKEVCFSSSGNLVYGNANYYKYNELGNAVYFTRVWKNNGKEKFIDRPVALSSISAMKPISKNRIAFTADYPEIGVMNDSGIVIWHNRSVKMNYNFMDSHFGINNTGNEIAFDSYDQNLYTFDIIKRSMALQTNDSSRFEFPANHNGSTSVAEYRNADMPVVNKIPLSYIIGRYERGICADVSNDGKYVCIGTNNTLHLVTDSTEQIWKIPLLQTITAVNISGNGKLVAAMFSDGMIRWYSMKNGRQLLTLFLHPDKKQWVLFTPAGYYDASPGTEQFLLSIKADDPDKEPGFHPQSDFKKEYYRPDMINRIFKDMAP